MVKQIVISKYFQKPAMDESLSHFQEKKKICTGPKINQKVNTKARSKKRVQGQKDIRTLIKSKKNELITFTKDFNDVCMQSGIDIDSQQLQLAIALSKSLQPDQTGAESLQSKKLLSSQERTNRVRRTLQEYGFKVPETKIKIDTTKRVKKHRKSYKLLLISEEERRQKIYDRYSQVLFENTNESILKDYIDCNLIDKGLYYLATNITYEFMRDNKIFYTSDILQEISYTKGNLLRDWSDIPGRPSSPKVEEKFLVSISDIQCTQSDLDTILSGSLKATKDILKLVDIGKKFHIEQSEKQSKHLVVDIGCSQNTSEVTEIPKQSNKSDNCIRENFKIDQSESTMLSLPHQKRSLSPDIFDDDDPTSLISNSIIDIDQGVKNASVTKTVTDNVLDLTGEVEVINIRNINKPCSQLSQNRTERRSNNFMDLTDCVPTFSQKIKSKVLSQSKTIAEVEVIHNECMEITECVNSTSLKCYDDAVKTNLTQNIENHEEISKPSYSEQTKENMPPLDLTQSSNSDEDLPIVKICDTQKDSLDDTIIIHYDNCNNGISTPTTSNRTIKKKSQLYKSNELEFNNDEEKNINIAVNVLNISEDQSLSYNNDNIQDVINNANISQNKSELKYANHISYDDENSDIDLTQSSDSSIEICQVSLNTNNTSTDSVYRDNTQGRSNTVYKSQDKIKSKDSNQEPNGDESGDIDLTQSSDSTVELYHLSSNSCKISQNSQSIDYGNLGKKDNVSIDYDEVCLDIAANACSLDEHFDNIQSKYANAELSKNYLVANCSNVSEPFVISDKEFDYSISKSRVENFDLGGIVDDISNVDKSKNNISFKDNTVNKSLEESYLPTVSFKDNKATHSNKQTEGFIKLGESTYSTPIKAVKDDMLSLKTPTNSEYVVKIGEITPMLDYAAMSSPERNKELEKYGLKPFKRKRAIQLLTHLYNQTHPVIEYCSEESIPSKKFKLDSLKKLKSPRQNKSPVYNSKLDKNIHEVTTDIPDIRDIECDTDNWIFQKREKAKIHSCRIPLHIAFHNYVSCRRLLREAILRYEPINIDVIHKDLVSYGHRYNPKDLLKFLDKKCITVKTADNNGRNNKK